MFKSHSRLHPHIKYHETSQNIEVHGSSYQRLGHMQLMLLLHILFCNSKNLYACSKDQRHLIQPMVKFPSGSVDNMVLFLLPDNNQICVVFRNAQTDQWSQDKRQFESLWI